MYRTDDPVADFNRWDAEQARKLARYPTCTECGEVILSDRCWEFDDGLICEFCLEENHQKDTSDYYKF